jgi:GTPase
VKKEIKPPHWGGKLKRINKKNIKNNIFNAPSDETPHVANGFTASVSLLYHPKEILAGFRTTVHVGNVRQGPILQNSFSAENVLEKNYNLKQRI